MEVFTISPAQFSLSSPLVIPGPVPYERRVAIPHDFGESGLDTGLIGNPDTKFVILSPDNTRMPIGTNEYRGGANPKSLIMNHVVAIPESDKSSINLLSKGIYY
jgi:hypothetical protein